MADSEQAKLQKYRVDSDAHRLIPDTTALLIVDMVYASVGADYGWVKMYRQMGLNDGCDYYLERLSETVIPNIKMLQRYFRQHEMPVIFTTVASETDDFSDWPARVQRRIETWTSQGFDHPYVHVWEDEAQVIEELAPRSSEHVINKTRFSAFNGSSIEAVLDKLGVSLLVITGVGTNFCVQCTLQDAYDYGYECILVEDATATLNPEMQEIAVKSMESYAKIASTGEVARDLENLLV